MAEQTFTIKFKMDPTDFKRQSRDVIRSHVMYLITPQVDNIAAEADRSNSARRAPEAVSSPPKRTKKLGSLGH